MEFTIENEILRVCVSSRGAELVSVAKKETGEELLWNADPAVWNRHAPMLFPYCGRLKNGRYTHKGTSYEGGPHGFARDMEHTLEDKSAASVTLSLEANALTMEKFPFAFKLTTTFALDGGTLHQTVAVHNDSDEEMPFGLGFHPGFQCPFDDAHKEEDYVLRFSQPESPTVIKTGETDGLVTGETYRFFENGTEIPLSDHTFDHDSICFSGLCSQRMSLVEKDSGRAVHVDIQGFPYVLAWSVKGPLRFVCIEPWKSLPDARTASGEWSEKPAAAVLKPGEDYSTTLTMEFAR